jgi:RNA polymerase sigma-70 factor (ECF subfamily)
MMSPEGVAVVELPRPLSMSDSRDVWSEADLLQACRDGRREGFDELVRRHYDPLLRLATVLAGREGAADVVQETFMAALRGLSRFRGEAKLSTWLISILRNQISLQRRSRQRWPAPLADEEARRRRATDPDPAPERLREVVARMKELPEELRTPLVLFHLEGLPYAEIAAVMGCPIGTVRSRLFEARERLRLLMTGAPKP